MSDHANIERLVLGSAFLRKEKNVQPIIGNSDTIPAIVVYQKGTMFLQIFYEFRYAKRLNSIRSLTRLFTHKNETGNYASDVCIQIVTST